MVMTCLTERGASHTRQGTHSEPKRQAQLIKLLPPPENGHSRKVVPSRVGHGMGTHSFHRAACGGRGVGWWSACLYPNGAGGRGPQALMQWGAGVLEGKFISGSKDQLSGKSYLKARNIKNTYVLKMQ